MAKREIAKRVKNAILYTDGTIRVDNVRCSYPHLFVPQEGDNGDKSYSCTGLMPKGTHKEAMKLIKEQIEKCLAENKATGKVGKDRWFLKDGDGSGKEEAKGQYVITAREKKRPSVRGKDKTPLSRDDSEVIYGGCFVNMLIRPWYQDNKFGKRCNANLIAVQFVRDGEPFGEGRIGEDEIDETFDDLDEDDDAGFDEDDFDGL